MKRLVLLLTFYVMVTAGYSQRVAINETGAAPHTSAILDVQTTDKGILIPRMTTEQRTMIASPAIGLLVFDSETGSFWMYSGTAWDELHSGPRDLIRDADGDTKVMVEESPDENKVRFQMSGTEHFVMDGPRLEVKNSGQNTFVGEGAGLSTDLSINRFNSAFGYNALLSNTTGQNNTAIGDQSLTFSTGSINTAVGSGSLKANTEGSENSALGTAALFTNTTGDANTAVGRSAMRFNTTGSNNTAVGYSALRANKANSRSTAIGFNAMFYADDRTTGIETFNTAVGYEALRSSTNPSVNTGKGNTAIGDQAMYFNTSGSWNTAVGSDAMWSNTTGFYNTACGLNALRANITGSYNTAIGDGALQLNSTGSYNTATGRFALLWSTTGSYNTAIGNGALHNNRANSRSTAVGASAMFFADDRATGRETFNTAVGYEALRGSTWAEDNTGRWNTAIGDEALWSNTSGGLNTATGRDALRSNTTGGSNTATGQRALFANATGAANTAIGLSALTNTVSGSSNVAIGAFSGNGAAGVSFTQSTFVGASSSPTVARTNVTMLGYGIANAQCTGSNQVLLGNTGISQIRAQVTSITAYSDARFKTQIEEDIKGLDFIMQLRPVSYNVRPTELHRIWGTPDSLTREIDHSEVEQVRYSGFLAQEVEEAARQSGFDFTGIDIPTDDHETYALRYTEFIMPMVKAMQEQQKLIEALQAEIKDLVSHINNSQ